jgi:hypothetical protein
MTLFQANEILGDRAEFELRHMVKALQLFGGFLNSPEDNQRLKAAKVVLRELAKSKRKPR